MSLFSIQVEQTKCSNSAYSFLGSKYIGKGFSWSIFDRVIFTFVQNPKAFRSQRQKLPVSKLQKTKTSNLLQSKSSLPPINEHLSINGRAVDILQNENQNPIVYSCSAHFPQYLSYIDTKLATELDTIYSISKHKNSFCEHIQDYQQLKQLIQRADGGILVMPVYNA